MLTVKEPVPFISYPTYTTYRLISGVHCESRTVHGRSTFFGKEPRSAAPMPEAPPVIAKIFGEAMSFDKSYDPVLADRFEVRQAPPCDK